MGFHNEQISVGGHPLSGILQGADYKITRLSGWWERPKVKRSEVSRELADGDFPSPWTFESRYITVGGFIEAADHGQMHHIMDQLNGLCVMRREWMTVQGHGPTTSALVEADDQPVMNQVTDKKLEFTLYFKASDPRRYGQSYVETVQGDYVTMRQMGNYPCYPRIQVRAETATEGFSLYANSPRGTTIWDYGAAAWGGIDRWIDMRTGQIFVDGVERPEIVQDARTWPIRPREPMRVRIIPNGGGTVEADVHFSDVWI